MFFTGGETIFKMKIVLTKMGTAFSQSGIVEMLILTGLKSNKKNGTVFCYSIFKFIKLNDYLK